MKSSFSPSDAKWVTLKLIHWRDQEGKERLWEVAERKTRGVAILPLLRSKVPSEPLSTLILEQYRPPAGNVVSSMTGNPPKPAAIRELKEETGFIAARIVESSPVLVPDAGMTTANMKLVVLDVEVDSLSDELPFQKLEDGEHIVRRIVELDELNTVLQDYAKRGFAIDARLSHFAMGWDFSRKFSKK
ncbi:hypothetical protein BS47DRAFT_1373554 [Hydnum rufescens UP504]|uniref:Nudix hydrolase domain-containing protein n=1 Tax=Hydnum rufescens UP504 TaxID=1448309 RepID=A0A9P6DNN1_9AGAM|nr:hypothetical protein BS47DRAFT_1373554 [Hydnum rufescens UP504]